jgi:hypothetical protein
VDTEEHPADLGPRAMSPAEAVQRAARKTLEQRSARLRTLWGADFDPDEIAFGSEGLVDLTLRRSMREHRSAKIEEWERKLSERFPWLDDDDDDDSPLEPFFTYEEGTSVIHGSGQYWTRVSTDGRSLRDPTLVLDLLAEHPLDGAAREGEEEVRGVLCVRYRGTLDARRFNQTLGEGPGDAPDRTLHVKAWVDPKGRIVRGSWHFAHIGRPRSPFRPTQPPVWRTVEFWDFGLPIDIQMPEPSPPPPDEPSSPLETARGLAEFGVDLWKRRRAWKRAHPGR